MCVHLRHKVTLTKISMLDIASMPSGPRLALATLACAVLSGANTGAASSTDSRQWPTSTIVAVVAGSVAGALILVGLIFLYMRRMTAPVKRSTAATTNMPLLTTLRELPSAKAPPVLP